MPIKRRLIYDGLYCSVPAEARRYRQFIRLTAWIEEEGHRAERRRFRGGDAADPDIKYQATPERSRS
jgi:hypothetical protein